jgi:hypothetical protein
LTACVTTVSNVNEADMEVAGSLGRVARKDKKWDNCANEAKANAPARKGKPQSRRALYWLLPN